MEESSYTYNPLMEEFTLELANRNRVLLIKSDITDELLESVCLHILEWNREDIDIPIGKRKPIYIYINSNGGECTIGLQVLSSIVTSKTPVYTVGFGKCFSMASYILAAGVKRYCFENTTVLYHDGSEGYYGSRNKMMDTRKYYDALASRLDNFIIEHSNMDKEFLKEIKDREYYMFSEEAQELGIVDYIIGKDCDIDAIF